MTTLPGVPPNNIHSFVPFAQQNLCYQSSTTTPSPWPITFNMRGNVAARITQDGVFEICVDMDDQKTMEFLALIGKFASTEVIAVRAYAK
jgi:hypothetical protein